MTEAPISRRDFVGSEVRIGGVAPFLLSKGSTPDNWERWEAADPWARQFNSLRRAIFSPEHRWPDQALLRHLSFQVPALHLSNGRELVGLTGHAYVLRYKVGIASLVWFVECGHEQFGRRELIELLALSRGTPERQTTTHQAHVDVTWDEAAHTFNDFRSFCEYIILEFRLGHCTQGHDHSDRFCYPVLYVGDVVGTNTASEISQSFAHDLAGILNLWIDDTEWLKQREVEGSLGLDYHPFEYGLTLASVSCTAEFHPGPAIQSVALAEGIDADSHHKEELVWLLNLCERPVSNLFGLRFYERELDDILSEPEFVGSAGIWSIIPLLGRAIKLSKLRAEMVTAIGHFRTSYFTRKSYMRAAYHQYQDEFGIAELFRSIDSKLQSLETTISNAYSMTTTLFALALTVLGLAVSALGVYLAAFHL